METNNMAELAIEFSRAINEMKSKLRQLIQVKINECDPDLSFELLEIIGLLWRKNGINQQEIGEFVSKDKSSITYLINCLVKRRLVERIENPADRRHKQIFLTARGKEKREVIFPLILDLYEKAAGTIEPAEITKSIQLVRQMTSNLT